MSKCFKVEQRRGEDVATARHIIYICNSAIYDMPVMDNSLYQGRKLDDLTTEIQDKGIFLSVLAPRRLAPLSKLFEKSGGDLAGAKEKNYAKEPRHLVLLNGFALQERAITPKPLPQPSVSPALPGLHDNVGQQQRPQVPGGPGGPQQPQYPGQGVINPGQGLPGPGGVQQGTPMQPGQGHPQRPQPGNKTLSELLERPPINRPPGSIMNRPPINPPQQQPGMMPQQPPQGVMNPGGGQGMVRPGMVPGQQPQGGRERDMIWRGELEWQEKVKDSDQKITHKVQCTVSTSKNEQGLPDVRSDNWPAKLIMQLIPKSLVQTIGGQYFRNSKSVLFHPQECESLVALTNVMGTGFAGCVHFTGVCDIKVLILLYSNDKKAYLGFIPNDQVSFVERIRTVIQEQKQGQHPVKPGPSPQSGPPGGGQPMRMPNMVGSGPMGGPGGNMMVSQPGMMAQQGGGQVMQMQQQPGGGQGQGGMMMPGQGGGGRMMMSVGQQNMIRQQQGGQAQYVTMSGAGPGMGQQRIMAGQQMTPGLRSMLQQQQPGMMNMMQQQGGMAGNNQVRHFQLR